MLAVNTSTRRGFLLRVASACSPRFAGGGAERVLLVGNSLSTANDLPSMVQSLSTGAGVRRLECQAVAFPDYSLEDHWNRGDAARTIAGGGWSAVVLQQGPSALPESRLLLVEYARRFDAVIRGAGARTALYMVW